MGLILDSSILIAGERWGETVKQVIQCVRSVHGDTESALSTISIIEFTHGIYRARTDAEKQRRKVFADELIRDMIVHPVSLAIASLPDESKANRQPGASPSPSKTSSSALQPYIWASMWLRST